jgi:hypothetical protein
MTRGISDPHFGDFAAPAEGSEARADRRIGQLLLYQTLGPGYDMGSRDNAEFLRVTNSGEALEFCFRQKPGGRPGSGGESDLGQVSFSDWRRRRVTANID